MSRRGRTDIVVLDKQTFEDLKADRERLQALEIKLLVDERRAGDCPQKGAHPRRGRPEVASAKNTQVVTRVLWSEPAVEQLQLIRRANLRLRVYRAVGGLARFPRRGRTPPEVVRHPDLQLPDEREIVFPRMARVFYRYDEAGDTILVLGVVFRGQEVAEDWLASLIAPEEG